MEAAMITLRYQRNDISAIACREWEIEVCPYLKQWRRYIDYEKDEIVYEYDDERPNDRKS
jgi:hypothetical protein